MMNGCGMDSKGIASPFLLRQGHAKGAAKLAIAEGSALLILRGQVFNHPAFHIADTEVSHACLLTGCFSFHASTPVSPSTA